MKQANAFYFATAFGIGLLFGLGLLLAGMTTPSKVLAFLDLAGLWDPSLALVMGGAVLVAVGPFALAKKRSTSLLGYAMHLPRKHHVDRRLVAGSVLFGIGWGLAGFCPGPAVVSLGAGNPKAMVFVLAMLGGMAIFEWLESRPAQPVAKGPLP